LIFSSEKLKVRHISTSDILSLQT